MTYIDRQFSCLEDRRMLKVKLRDGSASETDWIGLDETALTEIQAALMRYEERMERQDAWEEQREIATRRGRRSVPGQ